MLTTILLSTIFWSDPTLVWDRNQHLQLGLPASLLNEPALADNLQSGLTTILRITVREKRGQREQSFQLAIRYDLWDEVYLIAESRSDGPAARHKANADGGLESWWRAQRFQVAKLVTDRDGIWLIAVEVLPFSVSEQQQTQAWLARTTGEAESSSPGGDGILAAIVSTSIKRKPLQRFRWEVLVQEP